MIMGFEELVMRIQAIMGWTTIQASRLVTANVYLLTGSMIPAVIDLDVPADIAHQVIEMARQSAGDCLELLHMS